MKHIIFITGLILLIISSVVFLMLMLIHGIRANDKNKRIRTVVYIILGVNVLNIAYFLYYFLTV